MTRQPIAGVGSRPSAWPSAWLSAWPGGACRAASTAAQPAMHERPHGSAPHRGVHVEVDQAMQRVADVLGREAPCSTTGSSHGSLGTRHVQACAAELGCRHGKRICMGSRAWAAAGARTLVLRARQLRHHLVAQQLHHLPHLQVVWRENTAHAAHRMHIGSRIMVVCMAAVGLWGSSQAVQPRGPTQPIAVGPAAAAGCEAWQRSAAHLVCHLGAQLAQAPQHVGQALQHKAASPRSGNASADTAMPANGRDTVASKQPARRGGPALQPAARPHAPPAARSRAARRHPPAAGSCRSPRPRRGPQRAAGRSRLCSPWRRLSR